MKNLKSNFDYLEIGSYEGNSAIFVATNFENANIDCIDNWNKTEDYENHKDFKNIEENFDANVKNLQNIKKLKVSSDEFFLEKVGEVFFPSFHWINIFQSLAELRWDSEKVGEVR